MQFSSPFAFNSSLGDLCTTPHLQDEEPSSPGPGGVGEFVELLPPESTRNVIVPLSDLQALSEPSPNEEMKVVTEAEADGRDLIQDLFWAMHSPITAAVPALGLPVTAIDAQGRGGIGNVGNRSIRCGSLVTRNRATDWVSEGKASCRAARNDATGPSLSVACPLAVTATFVAADSEDGVAQLEILRFYELQIRCTAPPPFDDASGGLYDVAVVIAKLSPQGSSGAGMVVHNDRGTAPHEGPWHTRVSRKRQQQDDADARVTDVVAVSGQSRFQLQLPVHRGQEGAQAQAPPLHVCFLEKGTFSVQVFTRPLTSALSYRSTYQATTQKTTPTTTMIPTNPHPSGTAWRLSCEVSPLICST